MGINIEQKNLCRLLLEDNEICFQIPLYQRNYSWQKKHCTQFFEDVISKARKDKDQYFGNIILCNSEMLVSKKVPLIIDGQQRIITTFLFLKAYNDWKEQTNDLNVQKKYFYNNDNELKLKFNTEDGICFGGLLNNKIIDENSLIIKNYKIFLSLFEKLNGEFIDEDFIKRGLRRMVVSVTILPLDEECQMIFERINTLNEILKPADLIRNYLLMNFDPTTQENIYNHYWLRIEQNVGENLNDFIRHFLISEMSKNITEKELYDHFKNHANSQGVEKKDLITKMHAFSEFYSFLLGINCNATTDLTSASQIISDIRLFKQHTCFPFLLKVIEKFTIKEINHNDFCSIFIIIRDYILRRIIVDKGTKNLNKFFSSLFTIVEMVSQNSKISLLSALQYYLVKKQISNDNWPTDQELKESLTRVKIYENKEVTKYLLLKLENHNSKEMLDGNANITIEHVMPRTLNEEWKADLGPSYEDIHTELLDTIGNLTLTGYNSELSNLSFSKKKIKIYEKKVTYNYLWDSIISKEKWNREEIVNRSIFLAERIIDIFPSPKIDDITISNKPVIFEYNLKNYKNLSNTKPLKMNINNEEFTVNDYRAMLKITLEYLKKEQPKIFEEKAVKTISLNENTKPVFGYWNENFPSRTMKLGDTKICYAYDFIPNDLVKIISKIVSDFGLNLEDIVFSVVAK